jgi:hypothetical protein
MFTLAECSVFIPFLLIGYVQEPNIYLSQPGVSFKTVLVGRKAKDIIRLINDELQPFAFNFNDTSVEMDNNGVPVLKVSPTTGIIGPKCEIPIEISFIPTTEKSYNFNLSCNIRKKPTPVSINVKGEGYDIHDILQTELLDGSIVDVKNGIENEFPFDFGVVQINEKRVRRLYIYNSGRFNFDFSMKFLKRFSCLSITPEVGTVVKGEKLLCELSFCPNSVNAYKDVKLTCQVQNGKSYSLSINGSGAKPFLKITPNALEFGTHFIYRENMTPVTKILEISNNDIGEMSLEFVFPVESSWLDFERGNITLSQGETKQIAFTFSPREARKYDANLKVEINGFSVIDIQVTGEGCEIRLETDIQNINFGAMRIGNSQVRTIKIFNKSKISTPINLGPPSVISGLSGFGCNFLNLNEIIIKPKSSVTLDIKFQPFRRITPFAEEISTEFAGITKKLFILSGTCQGTEIRLENDTLPFGAVVQKSYTTRKLQLQNVGDIGAKFSWEVQKLHQDFSISPREGYISPGMEIPLEIAFHPTELNLDIRATNIVCKVEGMGKLYLTLSGSCVPQPAQIDIIKYSTPVRTPETKGIVLNNRTSTNWNISPIIDNENWTGPRMIEVESGQSKTYDLVFNPPETTGNGEAGKHEGSIFFPLPDGTGLLYKLSGVADKVLPNGNITRELPSKTSFTEVLSVTNWLRRSQRLRVVFELIKPDPAVIVKGHEYIDLLASQTKEYKFTYFAFKEGLSNLKITFRNETTQEYIFYSVNYKNLPPGLISTIEIMSPIRQIQSREIVISNPLSVPSVFTSSCSNNEVIIPHTFTIQPK